MNTKKSLFGLALAVAVVFLIFIVLTLNNPSPLTETEKEYIDSAELTESESKVLASNEITSGEQQALMNVFKVRRALGLYHNDQGVYPDYSGTIDGGCLSDQGFSGIVKGGDDQVGCTADSGKVYMQPIPSIPEGPSPADCGPTCDDFDFALRRFNYYTNDKLDNYFIQFGVYNESTSRSVVWCATRHDVYLANCSEIEDINK